MIAVRSDETLRADVTHELAWDSRVDAGTVHASVTNGIVTLRGSAQSHAERTAAVHAAHRVPGVLDVVDEIVVAPEPGRERSDADLAAAVRHTLQWDVHVPDARIQSTVSGGWVTLEGEVDVLREREDAERAVGALLGVRGVHDRLAVAARPIDVAGVRTAIEGALARLAHHEANRITVTVDDGIVTLAGTVDSAAERRAVLGVATHLPGIRAVHDRLALADRGVAGLRAEPR